MPDVTQNVIIEFISDSTQLQPGIDKLVETGKVEKQVGEDFKKTNAEIIKQQQALADIGKVTTQIDAAGKVTKKNLGDLVKIIKGQSSAFQQEIKKGVIDALHDAGLSSKEFEKLLGEALGQTEPKIISLKSQLRGMVEQLAQLKVQGKDTGQEYLDLAQKAGILKDAINDANQQVKGFGSDTSTFDGLIQGVQGLAGGFAVVQGAAALFGDESEELQKTLLRVNAAMAILQGLQQIQVILQKESAASQLANTIATKAQAAALAVYNFVVGTSTGLTKAFRIALASTGIGLLVIGLVELVSMLNNTDNSLENVNAELERQKNLVDVLNKSIQDSVDIEAQRAETAGKAESEIIRIRGKGLIAQRKNTEQIREDQITVRNSLKAGTEGWVALNNAIEDNNKVIHDLNKDIVIEALRLEKQLADERKEAAKKREEDAKKAADDAKKRREDALQKEKEARTAGFADFKASVEIELLAAEKGSQEELEIRKRLLRAELQQALDNDKLTENQRKLAIKKFFADRIQLEKDFARERDKIILENISADIQAELQGLELSNQRKLELTETAILLQAQIEVDAAEGNAAKIAEINAKRDKSIRDARIASIEEELAFELSSAETANASNLRALNKQLDNEKTTAKERIAIIDHITALQLDANFKRIQALNKERQDGLISQKEYNKKYAELIDEQTKIVQDGEDKKTESTKKGNAERIANIKAEISQVAEIAGTVVDVLGSIFSAQSERENNHLTEERQKIKDLQDAGAITEKDAVTRLKRLDAEERKIKQQQAQRDKQLALFNAIISTARGIAEAIPNPFLIALAAAVGAAQIAIIASRPIPKFGKGKRGSYEGLAEVGETGTELIQRNGRMEVANKRQITWLGKNDKVFNPMETAAMLSHSSMNTDRSDVTTTNNNIKIDYDKLGEAVGKHVQTNVYVDGVGEQTIKKKSFENYLDARRTF